MSLPILLFPVFVLAGSATGEIGQINGYGPVNVEDLNPLLLSWNQVHYLVRESLLEIDQLGKMQDEFFTELHQCFGLEGCLRHAGLTNSPPIGHGPLSEGSLLAALRRDYKTLGTKHGGLESGLDRMRERYNATVTRGRNWAATSSSYENNQQASSFRKASNSQSSYSSIYDSSASQQRGRSQSHRYNQDRHLPEWEHQRQFD